MDTKEQIRQQLDRMFVDAPKTRAAYELQEELLANCMDRYEDLTRDGTDPQQALQQVLGSVGNVDELIASLPGEDNVASTAMEAQRRRNSAVTVTVAVGLYIFAGVVLIVGVLLGDYIYEPFVYIGLIAAGIICIVPTCMLVYNAYRWPKYEKKADTVVEDFKQWNSDNDKSKSLRKAISSLLWSLIVVVYLLVSFLTFAWSITWIIFLIGACLESVITLIFRLKEL